MGAGAEGFDTAGLRDTGFGAATGTGLSVAGAGLVAASFGAAVAAGFGAAAALWDATGAEGLAADDDLSEVAAAAALPGREPAADDVLEAALVDFTSIAAPPEELEGPLLLLLLTGSSIAAPERSGSCDRE